MAEVQASLVLDLSQAVAEIDQLSSDIDSATSDVSLTLDVESTVDEVQAELDSLSADAIDVPVEADVSDAEAEIQGLDADPVQIPVEADTAQAEESLSGLGESAAGAAGGFDVLGGAAGSFGGVAGAVTGDVSGLTGALGSFGPQAAGAAAAGGIVASAFSEFSGAAIEAIGAEQRFAAATGDLGAEIRSIEVGGLNDDLGELAISLGGSDEAALDAASNLVRIGEAAGATDSEIATFTEGLFAFEAAAIASGLASGSLGDNTQRLASGFARGGRFLQNFGVSLTSAQIAQQALLETGKSSASQLTQFEKAQAGVNLALAQNPNLAAQVAAGQQNIEVQIARTKAEFGEFIEELGRPLAPQFVEILGKATALAADFAPELAGVSEAAGDATIGLLDTADALLQVSNGLQFLGVENEDLIEVLGTGLPQLVSNISESGDALGKSLQNVGAKGSEAAGGLNETEQAAQAIAATLPTVADSFNEVQDAAPDLAEAFGIIGAATDPTILAENIQAQADLLTVFFSNLNTIADSGFEQLAGTLQQIGPEAAGLAFELAAALNSGDVVEAARLQNAISNLEDASGQISGLGTQTGAGFSSAAQAAISTGGEAVAAASDAVGTSAAQGVATGFQVASGLIATQMGLVEATVAMQGVSLAAAAGTVGQQAGYRLGVAFAQTAPPFVSTAMGVVTATIATSGGAAAGSAGSVGFRIGSNLGVGIQQGIQATAGGIAAAAAQAVNAAEAAARAAADIQSPSKVWAEMGANMGAGMALGLAGSAGEVVAAAEALTRQASVGALSAVGTAGAGSATFGGVNVVVHADGAQASAQDIGRAVKDGANQAIEAQRLAFDSRAAR